jgi:hypothetical protein
MKEQLLEALRDDDVRHELQVLFARSLRQVFAHPEAFGAKALSATFRYGDLSEPQLTDEEIAQTVQKTARSNVTFDVPYECGKLAEAEAAQE